MRLLNIELRMGRKVGLDSVDQSHAVRGADELLDVTVLMQKIRNARKNN